MRLFRQDDRGQTMAEYSVILAVITVVVVAAVSTFSEAVRGSIQRVLALIPA